MLEVLLVIGGSCFIIFSFIKNTYYHGFIFAKSEAKMHLWGIWIIALSFTDVLIKGKTEQDII